MVRLMMRFFREVCRVPEHKFRGAVHIHPHLDAEQARRFWSEMSGIPLVQFHRTQFSVSRASQQKRDTLPFGTFQIVISDVRYRCAIAGWIEGLCRWTDAGANSSAVEHSAYIRAVTGSNPVSPMSQDPRSVINRTDEEIVDVAARTG